MNKLNIIKISSVIFILLLFAIGMIFFRKDNNENEITEVTEEVENHNQEEINSQEEISIRSIAENFIRIYYSYTWGNFANIESQYYAMTEDMKSQEENKVAKLKEQLINSPQIYSTNKAYIISSEFIEYTDAKATLRINIETETFAGAMTQRDTMVWVDENGKQYNGNYKDLITKMEQKTIYISLVKVKNEWKIDNIS